MRIVLGFFWFVCGAIWMILIAFSLRPKLAEAVRQAHVTTGEASLFLRGVTISIGLLCGVLGMIGVVTNQPMPLCIEPFSFGDWPSAASNGVILIAWTALLGWVWLGSGADLLGRLTPTLIGAPRWRRLYSPWSVRVVVSLLIAVAGVGAFVSSRTVAQERSGFCTTG